MNRRRTENRLRTEEHLRLQSLRARERDCELLLYGEGEGGGGGDPGKDFARLNRMLDEIRDEMFKILCENSSNRGKQIPLDPLNRL